MLPWVFAGENIVSLPGPSWAENVQVVVLLAGVFLGATFALYALGRRGRSRLIGLLLAVALGLALPAAAWIGLRGRTGFELGAWSVTCERPVVAGYDAGPIGAVPRPPGALPALDADAAVAGCRSRGAARVHKAQALVGVAVLLLGGAAALVVTRERKVPEPPLHTE